MALNRFDAITFKRVSVREKNIKTSRKHQDISKHQDKKTHSDYNVKRNQHL